MKTFFVLIWCVCAVAAEPVTVRVSTEPELRSALSPIRTQDVSIEVAGVIHLSRDLDYHDKSPRACRIVGVTPDAELSLDSAPGVDWTLDAEYYAGLALGCRSVVIRDLKISHLERRGSALDIHVDSLDLER